MHPYLFGLRNALYLRDSLRVHGYTAVLGPRGFNFGNITSRIVALFKSAEKRGLGTLFRKLTPDITQDETDIREILDAKIDEWLEILISIVVFRGRKKSSDPFISFSDSPARNFRCGIWDG